SSTNHLNDRSRRMKSSSESIRDMFNTRHSFERTGGSNVFQHSVGIEENDVPVAHFGAGGVQFIYFDVRNGALELMADGFRRDAPGVTRDRRQLSVRPRSGHDAARFSSRSIAALSSSILKRASARYVSLSPRAFAAS
ncbi:MAG: hypothetical protein KJ961_01230, partial [Alphaproteobacteria bacterium]|nr:hypothetical protein [Alphaproteobacteria bacterium]